MASRRRFRAGVLSVVILAVLGGTGRLASAEPEKGPAGTKETLGDPETLAAVSAVKRAIVAGHKARDRAALDRLYAPDYTAIDSKGKVTTKQDLLDGLDKAPDIVEGTYEIRAARRWGDIVVAPGHGHLVYRNPNGSTRVSDYDSVNVFRWSDGRWLYAAAFLP